MSRETDSSSSGPQGGGGTAYPSGTPPYGSRQYPSLHPAQDAQDESAEAAAKPDEPRTETTLTTRIRINIPGSRPIPPVVMRTPMSDLDARRMADGARSTEGAKSASGAKSTSAPMSALGPLDTPGTRGGAGERPAERTGSTARPVAVGETPDASAPLRPRDAAPVEGEGPAQGPVDKPAEQKTSDWFAPRKSPTQASVPAQAAPAAPAAPAARTAPQSGPRPQGALGAAGPAGPTRTGGPAGPTTGPVTGTSPFAKGDASPAGVSGAPAAPGVPGATGGGAGRAPRMGDDTAVLTPQSPSDTGPTAMPGPSTPAGNVSGDTLTSGIPVVPSQQRSPFAPPDPMAPMAPTAPSTPVSGPEVSPWPSSGPGPVRGSGPGRDFDARDHAARNFPGPSGPPSPFAQGAPAPTGAQAQAEAPRPAKPAKKGRSKAVLAGAGVFGVLVVAYGAGLLLNHSDVPKGTTVLGVDIGGGTKEEAVSKLDAALGDRAAAPLELAVGGKREKLAPGNAGLALDSQATVRAAAGTDYNPVSVIGSLFGAELVAQPVFPVDEEKLQVALSDLAIASGSATEGTIRFEPNKAVAVPGKAGASLDVGKSVISVKDAYRAQVGTGRPNLVELPVGTSEPTVDQAELDRAMKEFAEPAMSGLVTIQAGGKQIQFGPARSLPKILSMKAVNGRLVEVYDKKAITELLDGVFDGITITKRDGKERPVSADDVAYAMQKALLGKTPEERTQEIALK
ncbi:hypothetical protein V1460_06885 [Streptomyces sp. SCSIO 30461]|uniref:hypothetical protein n=1 Tax=Streptomyces sp. SCSIO 30461 TaxID=3118085 RepID=UPI0030CC8815